MKRSLCFIFILIYIFSLISCGKNTAIETSYFDKTMISTSVSVSDTKCASTEQTSSVTERMEDSETLEKPESDTSTVSTQRTEILETTESVGTLGSAEEMVWVSVTGKKYHAKSNCSNMKNPSHITLDQAINSRYEPCKKCYG